MKTPYLAVWLLICAPIHAQVYRCPEIYPHDEEALTLANAEMRIGQRNGHTTLHGDIAEVKNGTDTHYNFPDAIPRWMVCQYGGPRINATAISPAQVIGAREWWVQLDSLVDVCDLKVREIKASGTDKAMWTAVANCKGKELPPPVMLE